MYENYVSTLNYDNFLRVDDENNEIIVKVIESEGPHETEKKPDHDELLAMLDRMIDSYSSLPENAMSTPITHYDFVSALMLLSSIVKRIP
ncbi:MAG: hypothetical protein Q8876_05645 [Bacillota bacterium]|nr:hypothetical protein [Bacillota bacterium]